MNHEQLQEIYEDSNTTHKECVEASIKAFQHYMNTYKYSICSGNGAIFIADVLYMLGVALDPTQNRYAKGISKFQKELVDGLTSGYQGMVFKKENK